MVFKSWKSDFLHKKIEFPNWRKILEQIQKIADIVLGF